jgi:hypothetical protein
MTFLSFSLTFGLLAVLLVVLDSKFKLCAFVLSMYSSREIEKPIDQYLSSMCDESLTCHGLNLNPRRFGGFTFIFISCGESCLLISWCAGDRCNMTDSDEYRVDGLSVVWPQNHRDGFPGLGLKTGNYGFVIWASKLPR